MRFEPKSDDELDRMGLLEEAVYDYEVIKAEDTKSKAGNDMIKAQVSVYGPSQVHVIFVYLLEAMPRIMKHFCVTTGMAEKYDSGELSALDMIGKQGKCKVKIEPAKDGYAARNSIDDFVNNDTPTGNLDKPAANPNPPANDQGIDDSDVPF